MMPRTQLLQPVRWDDMTPDDLEGLARNGVRAMLRLAGEDPTREGLLDTPGRVVRAFAELTDRRGDPSALLKRTFEGTDYPADEIIAVGPIPFTSICEHHLLPFSGTAWIGYLPNEEGGVVGLSKLPRLLDHYAARPQVQERLTTQVADALVEHLDPQAAGCIVRATHTCMSLRGVKKTGAVMVTSVLRGRFKEEAAMRAEFLGLAHD